MCCGDWLGEKTEGRACGAALAPDGSASEWSATGLRGKWVVPNTPS